jgi:hypothetical protein
MPSFGWAAARTSASRAPQILFVADVIPLELRRIVEFLNEQMDPAEALAIELRQFESEYLKVLVPRVCITPALGFVERQKVTSSATYP